MQTMINIQTKMIGKKRPLISQWAIPIPEEMGKSSRTTLRDLIALVVEREVQAFQTRQDERRFVRLLTREQIENAAQKGKIDAADRPLAAQDVVVDPEQAVSNALTAFEDGLYYVFIDDVQVENLDQPLYLADDSQVTFLRLVPLAGG